MKTSKEAISIYEKVNRLWKRLSQPRLVGRLPSKTSYGEKNPNYEKHYTPVDFNTAKKFVKKAWSLYVADRSDYRGSKKFPYKIKQVQGNKHTWVWRGTLSINCDFGWCEINHEWSHYLGYMINLKRPHCAEHASLEFRMAKLIDKNYYQDSLANLKAEKKVEPAMKKNVIALRYERMLKRKAKWEKQAKRATNALRKVSKEIANYENRHSQEKLTTKMIPVSEKKKVKSYKQKLEEFVRQENNHVSFEKDHLGIGEFRFEVSDHRVCGEECRNADYDLDSYDQRTDLWSWKQAYEFALKVQERDTSNWVVCDYC